MSYRRLIQGSAIVAVLFVAVFVLSKGVCASTCEQAAENAFNTANAAYDTAFRAWHTQSETCTGQCQTTCGSYPPESQQLFNCIQGYNSAVLSQAEDDMFLSANQMSNCVAEVDFCDNARARRDACMVHWYNSQGTSDPEEQVFYMNQYYACLQSSGIYSCE